MASPYCLHTVCTASCYVPQDGLLTRTLLCDLGIGGSGGLQQGAEGGQGQGGGAVGRQRKGGCGLAAYCVIMTKPGHCRSPPSAWWMPMALPLLIGS